MKLFLVMSDSHGDIACLKKIIEEYPSVDSVIHLGDYMKDALILKGCFPGKEYFMAPGNCDSFYSDSAGEITMEVEGVKILLTHGNRYGVKHGPDILIKRVINGQFNIALYGHTHISGIIKNRDYLIVNPGSAGYPRDGGPPTYALLEICKGKAEARIMEVV